MAFRLDTSGSVRKVEPTPQGGLRVQAAVRKVGILEYPRADGSVRREFVPPEEVGPNTTLRGAPVTNRHPPGAVTRKNYRQYAVGHADSEGEAEGEHLLTSVVIQADDALTSLELGVREVSAGYTCDLDETPGSWNGQNYDAIQRNTKFNHIALVPRGRAGASVCLRLDANGDSIALDTSESPKDAMTPEQIAKLQADLAAATARADAAEALAKTEKARADKAEGSLAVEKARADAAELQVQTRKDVDELARVTAIATKLVKGFKADGKTAAQVKAEVVTARFPGLKLDAKDSPERLDGMFEAAAAQAPKDNAAELRSVVRAPETRNDAPATRRDADTARAEMLRNQENAYKPKPAAKQN